MNQTVYIIITITNLSFSTVSSQNQISFTVILKAIATPISINNIRGIPPVIITILKLIILSIRHHGQLIKIRFIFKISSIPISSRLSEKTTTATINKTSHTTIRSNNLTQIAILVITHLCLSPQSISHLPNLTPVIQQHISSGTISIPHLYTTIIPISILNLLAAITPTFFYQPPLSVILKQTFRTINISHRSNSKTIIVSIANRSLRCSHTQQLLTSTIITIICHPSITVSCPNNSTLTIVNKIRFLPITILPTGEVAISVSCLEAIAISILQIVETTIRPESNNSTITLSELINIFHLSQNHSYIRGTSKTTIILGLKNQTTRAIFNSNIAILIKHRSNIPKESLTTTKGTQTIANDNILIITSLLQLKTE